MFSYHHFVFFATASFVLLIELALALLSIAVILSIVTHRQKPMPPLQYDEWKNFDSFNPW